MKYLLYNKKLGYYQGSFMDTAFWSNLERISDYVVAFNNADEIERYVMTKFYDELMPYGDYRGKAFDLKFQQIQCRENYVLFDAIKWYFYHGERSGMEDQEALDVMLKLLDGKKTIRFNGSSLHAGYLFHILGIFDEEQVAVKYFGKHRQWWHYQFFDMWDLYFAYQNGNLEIK